MDEREFLESIIRQEAGSSLITKELNGSSGAKIFLCGQKIYKVGIIEEIRKALSAYGRFAKALLPDDCRDIFPVARPLMQNDKMGACEIEFVGRRSLEDVFLSFDGTTEVLDELMRLNSEALIKIKRLFDLTREKSRQGSRSGKLFLDDLIAAIRINLKKAGIGDDDFRPLADQIRRMRRLFICDFIPSLSHNDLSVGNVIVDDRSRNIKFIDPRAAVPYLDKSRADGNIVVDLVGYYISVLRKEAELQKSKPLISLYPLRNTIEKAVDACGRQKIFTPLLKDLCNLLWYSVYAACNCAYCTAIERIWLYESMRNETKRSLLKIRETLSELN